MTGWKDSLQRRDEVKAAFLEGLAEGADCSFLPGELEKEKQNIWTASVARRKLEEPMEEKP